MLVKLQTSRRFVSSSTGNVEAVCRGEHLAGGEDGAAAAVQGQAEVGEVNQQHHLATPRPWVFLYIFRKLVSCFLLMAKMSFRKNTSPCLPGVLVLPRLLAVDGPLHPVPMLVPGHGLAAAALGVRVREEVAVDGGGQAGHAAGHRLH